MKKQRKKILIILILLIILVTTASLTLGKYAYNSIWNYYLSSKDFYFESDLLDINTKKNSLLRWDGNNVYFTVKNSLNKELISEYDISYKITCTVLNEQADYIDCILNGTNSSVFNGSLASIAKCKNVVDSEDVSALNKTECELNGYTWYEGITSKDNYFNLTLKDATKEIDEVSVKIVAESLTPYHKTLVGVFNLNKVDEEEADVVTYFQTFDDYDELSIINTTTSEKCLLIGFDANNYLLDLDINSVLEYNTDSNGKINEIKTKIEKQKSVVYNFYKLNDEKTYSISDFSIEEKEC